MKKLFSFLRWTLLALLAIIVIAVALLYKSDIPADTIKAKYTNNESKFMPLMGMQVHYRDEGNMNDTLPIVLIHGTSSSLHTWDSITPGLIKFKRVIRFDLPAFGLTGASPERNYSTEFYNTFIDSLLTKLNVNQYIIGGNSLGGGIAWNQAVAFPDKVKKLILIDASGYPRKNEKGSIGFKLAAMPVIGNALVYLTPKSLIKKSLENTYANKSLVNDALVTRYFELLLREGNRKATLDIFRRKMQPTPEKIKGIKIPTLIIWGDEDQLIDVSNAYQFQKDIKGSQLLVIKHAGHVPMEETPFVVEKAIADFLQK